MKQIIKAASILLFTLIIFSNINCEKDVVNQAPYKPVGIYPKNNSNLNSIPLTLDWTCVDNDSETLTYDLYYDTKTPPDLLASDLDTNSYSNFTAESQGKYYWKIVAKDEQGNQTESDIWTFSIKNLPPTMPENPSPEDNSVDQTTTTISWECSEPDGEEISYDIYFGTSETPELIEENYTQKTYELQNIKGNQKYYWQIIAKDINGNEVTGPIWNFNTIFLKPEATYPVNNEQNAAWFPKFTWNNNNSGTFTYDLYLGTSNNPELLVSDLTDATYHSDRLTKEQTYYWKVVAKDEESGKTAESPVWSFKVFGDPVLGTYFDVRDNYTYKTVKIGNQTWFAENLRYNLEGSRVYDDDPENEAIYGRLYTWYQMMNGEEESNTNPSGVQGIAPYGAHVPSKEEWYELINFLGGIDIAGKYLKAEGTEFWNTENEGTNESDFNAIGGGLYYYLGESSSYYGKGIHASFLSTSLNHENYYSVELFLLSHYNNNIWRDFYTAPNASAISLRCIVNN
ncbi:MAG: hypothetical protein GXO49_08085 [Chlorobi bacterium]|nr:hypothetical protein [Chlorobiota bacterium]